MLNFFKTLKKFHSVAVMVLFLLHRQKEAQKLRGLREDTGVQDQVRHYSLVIQAGGLSVYGSYIDSHLSAFKEVY